MPEITLIGSVEGEGLHCREWQSRSWILDRVSGERRLSIHCSPDYRCDLTNYVVFTLRKMYVMTWMRNVTHRLRYSNTWSSADGPVRGGVGGTDLLEEALRSSYIIPLVVRFLCLVLVLEDVGFHLPAPVTMHAVCYRAFAPTWWTFSHMGWTPKEVLPSTYCLGRGILSHQQNSSLHRT